MFRWSRSQDTGLLDSAAMSRKIRSFSLFLLLFGVFFTQGTRAHAHDFWLEPDGIVKVGQDLPVRMWVGDKLTRVEEDVYIARRAWRFEHHQTSGTTDLRDAAA